MQKILLEFGTKVVIVDIQQVSTAVLVFTLQGSSESTEWGNNTQEIA